METVGDRIKEIRKQLAFNQEGFAKFIGLKNANDVSRYERNKNKPVLTILINIAQRCDISLNWLITGEGDRHKQGGAFKLTIEKKIEQTIPSKILLRPIPVLNTIPAGFPETPVDDYVIDWVLIPAEFSDLKTFALIVEGNSMAPIINDKDIVVISPNTKVHSGQIGVFRINDEVTIRKFLIEDGKTYLLSENSKYAPIVLEEGNEVTAIGRAVYQLKKL